MCAEIGVSATFDVRRPCCFDSALTLGYERSLLTCNCYTVMSGIRLLWQLWLVTDRYRLNAPSQQNHWLRTRPWFRSKLKCHKVRIHHVTGVMHIWEASGGLVGI